MQKKHMAKRCRAWVAQTRSKIKQQRQQRIIETVRNEIAARIAHRPPKEGRKINEQKAAESAEAARTETMPAKGNKRARREDVSQPSAAKTTAPEEHRQGQEQRPEGQERKASKTFEYECPYCNAKAYSRVSNGNVQVTGHCGKQFRVANGVVARAFAHACPRCGTVVQSSREFGRIQSKHKKPGKTCETTQWVER